MEELPKDPVMLMSLVNMVLRDEPDLTLERLCARYGVTVDELNKRLAAVGFEWNAEQRKYW